MRRLTAILFLVAVVAPLSSQTLEQLVDICVRQLGEATYLRDFQVDLEAAEPGHAAPVARYSMVLNRNTQYRLSVCNSETSPGRGIIQIFDTRGLIGSNYSESTGEIYPYFDIQIQSTGIYHVFISFQDGRAGTAVGILSYVRRL